MNLILRTFLSTCILLFVAACSDDDNGGIDSGAGLSPQPTAPSLELSFSAPPIAIPNAVANYAENVEYGSGERNVFDILLPESDEPTPLVIFIHGGAYVTGDKSNAWEFAEEDINRYLEAGVAFATLNYYLLSVEPIDDLGVIQSLNDAARALQFIRYHAEALNIDPEQIASYGVSAGASTSLWLGTRDDMAQPDSSDPILRESTRINAVGALITQSTLDLLDWEVVLGPILEPLGPALGGTDIVTIANALNQVDLLLAFFGIDTTDEIDTPEITELRAQLDNLENMDAGDAPIFSLNITPAPDDLVDVFFHHGLHAVAIKNRADEVGLHSVVYVEDPIYGITDPSGEDVASFMLRHIR